MENLIRITSEFQESDMRKKLKDCQRFRIQDYQHQGRYIEGDLVWFQNLNANTWLGPAAVLCHRGQSIWFHTHGGVKKVASCRVKPYQLINRPFVDNKSKENEENQVMLEDGICDVNDLKKEDQDMAMEEGYYRS